ncbi:NAD(P)-dependent dehydrogenase (short-subunit alcohol dehydrogenase family) [Weissella uvarum]|uniref:short chain dehydrogenase n=1 Tax=Weissella uvarum TaxID=1479233 RepID=UPI0019606E11|nr:short chain dehydrogenase [Weissella uvarum]MBM7616987.1 NAD(P)-dependent dehydrogenase (short-subunit alcohol dehydrogenase family) [Weissella uvarum]MCM0595287.1 short chain dehydrogenase [Weissella uvarum]
MKILVVGGNGTLGKAVVEKLKDLGHEVLVAGRHEADVYVDLTLPESIEQMYATVENIDHVISTAGQTTAKPLVEMKPTDNQLSIDSKLLGQINLVLLGQHIINDGGGFTLTTGVKKDDPIVGGASAAMANGGITAFVKTAAIELPRGLRINSVSPNIVEESFEQQKDTFMGFTPVPISKVANAFVKSVVGQQTGQEYKIYQ